MTAEAEAATRAIQTKYDEFRNACKSILPKVDRKLIDDFLFRQEEDSDAKLKYMIEVNTKEGLDKQEVKNLIWSKIGQMPDADYHGTWYRIQHTITLANLKQLSDHDYVLSVKGSCAPY